MESSRFKNEINESHIIEKILNGEIDLFELLMRRHNELLFRTIRSFIDVEAEIEDIMQETYMKAYIKLYQFKSESKFSTWLVRIGINEAIQRKKKLSERRTISIEDDDRFLQVVDKSILTPEIGIMHNEFTSFMEKAIDTLPEKYKIVFVLKEVEGMNIQEISKCLDLSNSNVKVRLHRAKVMLQDSVLNLGDYSNVFEFGNSKCDYIVCCVLKRIHMI